MWRNLHHRNNSVRFLPLIQHQGTHCFSLKNREKWFLELGGKQNWDKDGSWGYRTPIYMLTRTIWLQEVLGIITNEITTVLELSLQQSQMRTFIYQYRTVEEGGACGKFNQPDCCIQIDDNWKVLTDIARNTGKIAHVLVQTMFLVKTMIGIVVVILTDVCLFPASYPS